MIALTLQQKILRLQLENLDRFKYNITSMQEHKQALIQQYPKEQTQGSPSCYLYRHQECAQIEQLAPVDQFSSKSNICSYNVTFPNQNMVRVNLIQLHECQSVIMQLHSSYQKEFTDNQLSSQSNSKTTLSYCNEKTHSVTCVKKINNRHSIKEVVKFLAKRKLFWQQKLSPSFSQQLFCGFDGIITNKYLIYGQKCQLPFKQFLQESIPKGFTISRFTNQMKYLFEDLRQSHIAPSWNKETQSSLSFWSIENFRYDVESKSILIDSSAIHDSNFIKENSQGVSFLKKFKQKGQEKEKLQSSEKCFKGSNEQIVYLMLNKSYTEPSQQNKAFNFYQEQSLKCQQFIQQTKETVFKEQTKSNNQVKKNSFRQSFSSNQNFQSMVLNNQQFKNQLTQKLLNFCGRKHSYVSKMPAILQQVVSKGKIYASVMTSNSYEEFVQTYSRTFPHSISFNPVTDLLPELTFFEAFLAEKSTKTLNNRLNYRLMRDMTKLLEKRYSSQLNYIDYEELLKHQKLILTTKIQHSYQIDTCLQMVEFKLVQLSIKAIYHKKQRKQGKFSPSMLLQKKSSNNSLRIQNSQQKNRYNQLLIFSSVQNYDQLSFMTKYQYQDLFLWEYISLRRNLNNLFYGQNKYQNQNKGQSKGTKKLLNKHDQSISANKNHHLSIQDLKEQLINQINHYKNQITHLQLNLIQQATYVKQTSAQQSVPPQQFYIKTIRSNLLILQFSTKIHFFSSLLKRLPPLPNFNQSIQHLDRILKIVKLAHESINELKNIGFSKSSKSQYQSEGTSEKQKQQSYDLLNEDISDFSNCFRQAQIVVMQEKLNILIHHLHQFGQETAQTCEILQNKIHSFYGKYHWQNIFFLISKLKLIEHNYNIQLNQFYFADNQDRYLTQKSSSTCSKQKFSSFKQQLTEIYAELKGIEYTNGQEIMSDFMQIYPLISKRLNVLDREVSKLLSKDSQMSLFLERRLTKFKIVNSLYPNGLYQLSTSQKQLNATHLSVQSDNKDQYSLAFGISPIVKSVESLIIPSLYYEEEKIFTQVKNSLQQIVKSFSGSNYLSLTLATVQNKFSKVLGLIRQQSMFKCFQGVIDEIENVNIDNVRMIKMDSITFSLLLSYVMVKTAEYMFIVKYLTAVQDNQRKQSLKQQLFSHINMITNIQSKIKLHPIAEIQLTYFKIITNLSYIKLFSIQQLTNQKTFLKSLISDINSFQQFISHQTDRLHLPILQSFGLELVCSEKLLPQLMKVMEEKKLFIGLLMRDHKIVREFYNRKIGDYSMMHFSYHKQYSHKKPVEQQGEKRSIQQSAKVQQVTTNNSPSQMLTSLPIQFRTSPQHLIILSEVNYHQQHYLLSFQYLETALQLIVNTIKKADKKSKSMQCQLEDIQLVRVIVKMMIRVLLEWGYQTGGQKEYFTIIGIQKMISVKVILSSLSLNQLSSIPSRHQSPPNLQPTSQLTSQYALYLFAFTYFSSSIINNLSKSQNKQSSTSPSQIQIFINLLCQRDQPQLLEQGLNIKSVGLLSHCLLFIQNINSSNHQANKFSNIKKIFRLLSFVKRILCRKQVYVQLIQKDIPDLQLRLNDQNEYFGMTQQIMNQVLTQLSHYFFSSITQKPSHSLNFQPCHNSDLQYTLQATKLQRILLEQIEIIKFLLIILYTDLIQQNQEHKIEEKQIIQQLDIHSHKLMSLIVAKGNLVVNSKLNLSQDFSESLLKMQGYDSIFIQKGKMLQLIQIKLVFYFHIQLLPIIESTHKLQPKNEQAKTSILIQILILLKRFHHHQQQQQPSQTYHPQQQLSRYQLTSYIHNLQQWCHLQLLKSINSSSQNIKQLESYSKMQILQSTLHLINRNSKLSSDWLLTVENNSLASSMIIALAESLSRERQNLNQRHSLITELLHLFHKIAHLFKSHQSTIPPQLHNLFTVIISCLESFTINYLHSYLSTNQKQKNINFQLCYQQFVHFLFVIQQQPASDSTNQLKSQMIVWLFLKHIYSMKGYFIHSTDRVNDLIAQKSIDVSLEGFSIILVSEFIRCHPHLSSLIKINLFHGEQPVQSISQLKITSDGSQINKIASLIRQSLPSLMPHHHMFTINSQSQNHHHYPNPKHTLQHLLQKYLNHLSHLIKLMKLPYKQYLISLSIGISIPQRQNYKQPLTDLHQPIVVKVALNQDIYSKAINQQGLNQLSLEDIESIQEQKQILTDLIELIQLNYNKLGLHYHSKDTSQQLKKPINSLNSSTSSSSPHFTKTNSQFISVLQAIYSLLHNNF